MRIEQIMSYSDLVKALARFNYDGIEKEAGIDVEAMVIAGFKSGVVFVGRDRDDIIGFGGLFSVNNDTAELWVVLNKKAKQHKTAVMRACKRFINGAKKTYRRLQAHCLDKERAKKFLERLGFAFEGRLKQFLNGQDFCIYAQISEDRHYVIR